ncbi:MAG TPA: hypothetical protein VF995_01310 [Actinomycetota bacterium]
MCEHHESATVPDPEPNRHLNSTRRDFLRGAGRIGAALLVPGASQVLSPTIADAATVDAAAEAGLFPTRLCRVSNAMHIHASFDEVDGSFDAQLAEATRCGINVMWPTDHDWRMQAIGYITTLRFLNPEMSNGTTVGYQASTSGSLTTSTAALDSVTSPGDPTGGSVHLAATSAGAEPASARMNVLPSDRLRANLTGQTLTMDVLAASVGTDAWLEVLINLSYHPPQAGRPAGNYQLSYRFGAAPAARRAQGLLGIVTVPVTPGEWNTGIALDPVSDIAALWPDLVANDHHLVDLWFGATSQAGAPAEGWFANGFISRAQTGGDDPLKVQAGIFDALADRYPTVRIRHGLEISLNARHSNWFGGSFHLPVYGQDLPTNGDVTAEATALIHAAGGLSSINHPFGVQSRDPATGGTSPQAAVDAARHAAALRYLGNNAYGGADIIEAGYHSRGAAAQGAVAALEDHLALWDTLSRNGLFLTGNGVSDNHTGHVGVWSDDSDRNTFATHLWSASDGEADLLDALRAGRAFCAEILGGFTGALWLQVDANPMGSVSVNPAARRPLIVVATGLPALGVVEVVRGPVDYAGTAQPDPATAVVATLPASAFANRGRVATVVIDTSASCFVRVNVVDTVTARRTAFSNPVWLLREPPPNGIPPARRAPDTHA